VDQHSRTIRTRIGTPEPHHRGQPRKPEDRDLSQFQVTRPGRVRDIHVNTLLQLSCAPRRPDYYEIETAE
jgi:hypothetical protein